MDGADLMPNLPFSPITLYAWAAVTPDGEIIVTTTEKSESLAWLCLQASTATEEGFGRSLAAMEDEGWTVRRFEMKETESADDRP